MPRWFLVALRLVSWKFRGCSWFWRPFERPRSKEQWPPSSFSDWRVQIKFRAEAVKVTVDFSFTKQKDSYRFTTGPHTWRSILWSTHFQNTLLLPLAEVKCIVGYLDVPSTHKSRLMHSWEKGPVYLTSCDLSAGTVLEIDDVWLE